MTKNIIVCIDSQPSANIGGACHENITRATALRLLRHTNEVQVIGNAVVFFKVIPRPFIQKNN